MKTHNKQTHESAGFQGLRKCMSVPPPARERESTRNREREKERDRDREGSCHSTDLSAQQSPIMGQSFLTSVQHDGVLLQH